MRHQHKRPPASLDRLPKITKDGMSDRHVLASVIVGAMTYTREALVAKYTDQLIKAGVAAEPDNWPLPVDEVDLRELLRIARREAIDEATSRLRAVLAAERMADALERLASNRSPSLMPPPYQPVIMSVADTQMHFVGESVVGDPPPEDPTVFRMEPRTGVMTMRAAQCASTSRV